MTDSALSPEESFSRTLEAARVFTPAAPIDEETLFAGRAREISQLLDAILQRGQHAIVYGERGVGKTSLANVLAPRLRALGERIIAPHHDCDSADDFTTVWTKMLTGLPAPGAMAQPGFTSSGSSELASEDRMPAQLTPDAVRR